MKYLNELEKKNLVAINGSTSLIIKEIHSTLKTILIGKSLFNILMVYLCLRVMIQMTGDWHMAEDENDHRDRLNEKSK